VALEEVNSLRVLHFRRSLEKKALSPQTVQHCLALLRRILRKALRLELYAGRLPHFDMPKFDNRRQRFLSTDEARRLLSHLRAGSPLWHEISLFALQTGLRAGEIFQLTREQASLHSRHITIFDSKNHMSRNVPLNATAYNILQRRLPERPSDFFFTNNGRPIMEAGTVFRRIVNTSGINAGVSDRRARVVFHTFRHTFASWLVQAGTPLMVVSTLLGHKTLTMTQRYAHLAPDQARAAVCALPSF
jgi:integrase